MLPFLISIPHCSARIPNEIKATLALNRQQVIESVDFGTREIFGRMPAGQIIRAQWSRLIIDPNRAPNQLDNKGVAAFTDYHGRNIYKNGQYPDQKTIFERVAKFHRPYHSQLQHALLNTNINGLIDGHSLNGTGPSDAPDPGQRRKDITLSNNGDLNGEARSGSGPISCPADQIRQFKRLFEAQGLSVSLNSPYQGGYITKNYGPQLVKEGRFAIQMELNQDLYMHPGDLKPETLRVAAIAKKVMRVLQNFYNTPSR